MPIYTFKNKRTGKTKDYEIRLADYDQFKVDHPNLERVFNTVGISFHARGTKSVTELAAKRDPAWAEVLSKIGQQNPHSELNANYTKNKTIKRLKAENVVEKHAKIQAKQAARRR